MHPVIDENMKTRLSKIFVNLSIPLSGSISHCKPNWTRLNELEFINMSPLELVRKAGSNYLQIGGYPNMQSLVSSELLKQTSCFTVDSSPERATQT